jgi:hypothetical protein
MAFHALGFEGDGLELDALRNATQRNAKHRASVSCEAPGSASVPCAVPCAGAGAVALRWSCASGRCARRNIYYIPH